MINRKEVFFISLTIFVTVVCWIVFDLVNLKYHSDIKGRYEEITKIKTNLNYQVINFLKNKK